MRSTRPGRARSESARLAIMHAAVRLLPELGFSGLTIERIASEAGVGKQTIYRWWPSKSAILAECVLEGLTPGFSPVVANSGDLEADLTEWLAVLQTALDEPGFRSLMRGMVVAAVEDDALRSALYENLALPSEPLLVERLEEARTSGQLRGSASPRVLAESLVGAVLYRLLATAADQSVRVDDLVELVAQPRR
ncbi:TetR family transcriptional regulator [Microterricola gilva]|uniref:TetR family transcriptional regulator n=1 Tax=Microterricola gilva TaxID=393267 RepID=A0A4Q8AMU2_9MICO|nr:TetR/AcrR family transcriptional regulator [Microterricola gilva]RZU65930.1 TetR family transcriptional regulator [Microterricola gilva]